MSRRFFLSIALPLFLIGCERAITPSRTLRMVDGFARAPADLRDPSAAFSYTHSLSLEMPADSIRPRYDRARFACLRLAKLDCTLLTASLSSEDDFQGASLTVALPHDKIDTFERSVLAPVPGEAPGLLSIAGRTTTADNVSAAETTANLKVAQLTDYRDRLLALTKRPNLAVDDLIKLDGELSKAEGDLNAAIADEKDVNQHVAKEQLTVMLNEQTGSGHALRPVVQVWKGSIELLGQSAADALEFLIRVVPWLPVVAAGIFLVRWLWRNASRPATKI